jgi:23S rRNA pseudouridine1911/1915/1917 synthase
MSRGLQPLLLIAAQSDQGMRLDRFLRSKSGVLSRTRARDLLASGAVSLNGKRVKIASRPLNPGDRVEVYVPPARRTSPTPPGAPPFRVVYEDSAVLVVDKAPGILVQPTPEGDRGTLLDLLRKYLRQRHPAARSPYLGLLHRIDRDTSGLLLFSRRGEANRILAEQFRSHSLAREYLALVRGTWAEDSGTIADSLSRPAPGARRSATPGRGRGKSAVTHYRVMERFPQATLLSVTLETGRTHQIRIHFSGRGHPVVGDRVYTTRTAATGSGLVDRFPRQALHAGRLGFTHPITGAWLNFEVPPPEDFAALLRSLRGAPA